MNSYHAGWQTSPLCTSIRPQLLSSFVPKHLNLNLYAPVNFNIKWTNRFCSTMIITVTITTWGVEDVLDVRYAQLLKLEQSWYKLASTILLPWNFSFVSLCWWKLRVAWVSNWPHLFVRHLFVGTGSHSTWQIDGHAPPAVDYAQLWIFAYFLLSSCSAWYITFSSRSSFTLNISSSIWS